MAVLRHQRSQHRHELRSAHVVHCYHLRDDLVRGGADVVRQIVARQQARVRIREDLDDVARGHRDEAVHLQDRQERLVERVRRHRRRGQDRHLRAHARVHDEVLAGHLAHGLDDLAEVGVLVVRRDLRALLCRRRERQGEHQHRGPACESLHASFLARRGLIR